MLGVQRSFLEAEYQCREGFKLVRRAKRKTSVRGDNLICRKRRWLGARPQCRPIKVKAQQCDSEEAAQCEQLCVKRANETEVTCKCHRGFRLIDARCFGKLQISRFCCAPEVSCKFPFLPALQTSTSAARQPRVAMTFVAVENASTHRARSSAAVSAALR
jgi:hypothetical protein